MVDEEKKSDREWFKSLPILLVSSILLITGAYAFVTRADPTAGVACLSAGLVVLGSWLTTGVVDWYLDPPPSKWEDDDGKSDR